MRGKETVAILAAQKPEPGLLFVWDCGDVCWGRFLWILLPRVHPFQSLLTNVKLFPAECSVKVRLMSSHTIPKASGKISFVDIWGNKASLFTQKPAKPVHRLRRNVENILTLGGLTIKAFPLQPYKRAGQSTLRHSSFSPEVGTLMTESGTTHRYIMSCTEPHTTLQYTGKGLCSRGKRKSSSVGLIWWGKEQPWKYQ